jgi:hypothetical protein
MNDRYYNRNRYRAGPRPAVKMGRAEADSS